MTLPGRPKPVHETFRGRHPRQFNPERLALSQGRTGLGLAVAAMLAFAVLFAIVRRNRSAAADIAITLRLQERQQKHPHFDRLMHAASWAGFPPQSRVLPPSYAGALWLLGFRLEAVFQLLAWGTSGISFLFKRIMRRARPGPGTPQIRVIVARIGGTSFPSGHVLNYMGVYGFLAFLAYTWLRPSAVRHIIVGAATFLIGLVGPSRIYLGHHWFTDVLASYLLGTAYLIGLSGLYRRMRMRITGVS